MWFGQVQFGWIRWSSLLLLGWVFPPAAEAVKPDPTEILSTLPTAGRAPVARIPRPRRGQPWGSIRRQKTSGIGQAILREAAPPVEIPRRELEPNFPQTRVRLLVVGDFRGEWLLPDCQSPKGSSPLLRAQTAVERANERSRLAQQPPPVLLDVGNGPGPHPFAMYLQAKDKALWQNLAARMEPDARVSGLGDREYGLPSPLPSTGRNRRGKGIGEEPFFTIRGGVKIAVLPIPGASDGGPPSPSRLRKISRQAEQLKKERRADILIGLSPAQEKGDTTRGLLRMARRLPHLDLLVTGSRTLDDRSYGLHTMRFTDPDLPRVLTRTGFPGEPLSINLDVIHRNGRFQLLGVERLAPPSRSTEPEAPWPGTWTEARDHYCAEWGLPLGDGSPASMDPEDWIALAGRTAQWSQQVDGVVLSRRTLNAPPLRPIPGPLTRDLVARLHPTPSRLFRLTELGSRLEAWLKSVARDAEALSPVGVRAAGLSMDEGELLVNGRAFDPTHRYSLILDETVLDGNGMSGPDLPEGILSRAQPTGTTLRQIILESLERNPSVRRSLSTGESRSPSLEDALQWKGSADTNLGFKWTAVHNPSEDTTQPQLSRSSFVGLDANFLGRLELENRKHEWANRLDMQFATVQTGGDSFSESKDITTFETLYSWLDARNRQGRTRVGIPVPFLRLRGETEWTRPVEAEFRHLELLGSTGARWLFSDELRLSAGLGIGGEVLQPEANAPLTADLAFEVLKLPITHWSDMPLLLEGRMDVFWKRPFGDDAVRALSTWRLAFGLTPYLALTLSNESFALVSSEVPFSWSSDILVGIQGYFAGHALLFPSP